MGITFQQDKITGHEQQCEEQSNQLLCWSLWLALRSIGAFTWLKVVIPECNMHCWSRTGDFLRTVTDAEDDLQLFWEAFPAEGGKARTTYMFAYCDTDRQRPSIEVLAPFQWSMINSLGKPPQLLPGSLHLFLQVSSHCFLQYLIRSFMNTYINSSRRLQRKFQKTY